jgi:hypothetical protein
MKWIAVCTQLSFISISLRKLKCSSICMLFVLQTVYVFIYIYIYIHTHTHTQTVGSQFVTIYFTTVHFYDPCRIGPSTPDLWCITVATWASFLYLVRFQLFSGVHVFLFFYFSAFLLIWLWFFHPWRPSKRQKRTNQNSWC